VAENPIGQPFSLSRLDIIAASATRLYRPALGIQNDEQGRTHFGPWLCQNAGSLPAHRGDLAHVARWTRLLSRAAHAGGRRVPPEPSHKNTPAERSNDCDRQAVGIWDKRCAEKPDNRATRNHDDRPVHTEFPLHTLGINNVVHTGIST
jgi:hypothetical protein